jgi:hypothetical protein
MKTKLIGAAIALNFLILANTVLSHAAQGKLTQPKSSSSQASKER